MFVHVGGGRRISGGRSAGARGSGVRGMGAVHVDRRGGVRSKRIGVGVAADKR